MNYSTSGFRVAYVVLIAGLGLLSNVDTVATLFADELEARTGSLHLTDYHHPGQLQGIAANDAAYAEAMQEHISHLA